MANFATYINRQNMTAQTHHEQERAKPMAFLTLPRLTATHSRRVAPSLRDLLALHRQRRQLARLDTQALRDIGLDQPAAEAESRRPLWDVPAHWHQD